MNYEDLLDLIDVVVATYNGEPQSGLGNYSPLQVIQDYVGNDTSMLVRHLPALVAGQPDLHVIVETVTVRGSLENGKRPYVEKDGERYTNALLADSATLLGEKIRIHIDQSDYRSFAAFLPNGQPLGVLRARGAWGTIPHTRDMRISINALIRSGKMVLGPGEEPISGFLRLLGQRALDEKESSKGKQEKISPSATRLARAFVETGAEMPDLVGPLPAVQSDAFLPSSEVAVPDFVQARKHSAKPFGGSRA